MLLKVCSLEVVIPYTEGKWNYHSLQIFLPFHWTRAHHVTSKKCLQIMVCSCAMSSSFFLFPYHVTKKRVALGTRMMRDRMSEIFGHPVTAASSAPRFPTTWPRNEWLWGREWALFGFHWRKMSDWSTRDHVTLPNSKWRQYLHRLFIPEERRLIAA